MRGIAGKVTLITGGIRGIGKGIARRFVEEGAQVIVTGSKDVENARKTVEELSKLGKIESYMADLSDAGAIDKMIDDVVKKYGRIDILINNAGIAQQKLFTDITNEDWNAMVGVNLSGVFYCCRAALPYMIRQKAGSIVNVSSMWGICGASCEVHYSAVKAGVIGLTKALAKEVGPSGIRVNCIAPGVIDTDMNAMHSADTMQELADQTPLGRVGAAAEVADSILYLCSDKSSFITGQVLGVTGGF